MGQAAMRLRADDVFYCPLPFHHNNALTFVLERGAHHGCDAGHGAQVQRLGILA
jgi:hypothetical protein